MEHELRFGLDFGRMADFSAFIASKSFDHHIPQKCLYNLWHILMYQKYTLQVSIGWLSVISSVLPLALIGFYL